MLGMVGLILLIMMAQRITIRQIANIVSKGGNGGNLQKSFATS